jgi:hypothetical protein
MKDLNINKFVNNGIVGDNAHGNTFNIKKTAFSSADLEALSIELDELSDHLANLPKTREQEKELELVKEAAAAAKAKQPSKMEVALKGLTTLGLGIAQQLSLRLLLGLFDI